MKLFNKIFIIFTILFTVVGLSAQDMNLSELAKFNGKNGNPAYIAVDGVIYDVSNAKNWKDGEHIPTEGRLKAGIDATEVIKKSPHGKGVLKELKVVGNLTK